jgi:hypothetical protein
VTGIQLIPAPEHEGDQRDSATGQVARSQFLKQLRGRRLSSPSGHTRSG